METPRSLDQVTIFKSLSPEQLKLIGEDCRWERFTTGQHIVRQADGSADVYFLIEGKAAIVADSTAGVPTVVRHIDQGDVFGAFAAISRMPRVATVEATTECLTAALQPDAFWNIMLVYPQVAQDTICCLVAHVRDLTDWLLEFSRSRIINRLHAQLLRLAQDGLREDGSAVISPKPDHADLASRILTYREVVTREIYRLAKSGLVERKGDVLVISDVKRLRKLVEEYSVTPLLAFDREGEKS